MTARHAAAALVLAGTAAWVATPLGADQAATPEWPRLTIERIAAWPNLAGTVPESPVWSRESARLAFLWNDEGHPFLDVWTVEASEGAPRRLTLFGEVQDSEALVEEEHAGLAARVVARNRRGVGEAIWMPDGRAVVLVHDDHFFRAAFDGSAPVRLTASRARRRALDFSSDGRTLSFLQDGDLWLWHQDTQSRVQVTRFAKPLRGPAGAGPFYRADAEVVGYRWSPDGRHIAILTEPFIDVSGEPVGTRKMDTQYRVDFRGEKKFSVGTHSLSVIADVFNLLNANVIVRLRDLRFGSPNFGLPAELQLPRQVRFGIRWDF